MFIIHGTPKAPFSLSFISINRKKPPPCSENIQAQRRHTNGRISSARYPVFTGSHGSSARHLLLSKPEKLPSGRTIPKAQISIFPLRRLLFQLFRRNLIILVHLSRHHMEPCREKFLNIESVLLIVIGQQMIVRMFCNVILLREKRPDASYLQQAFSSIHNSQLVHRHQILS